MDTDITHITQLMTVSVFALLLYLGTPSNVTHVMLGDAYYHAFDNEHALDEYLLAYKESPTDFAALERLVQIYNDNGRIHLRRDSLSESDYRIALFYADSLVHYYPDSAASQFWFALSKGSLIPFVGIKEKIAIGKEVRQSVSRAIDRDSAFSYPDVVRAIFEREGAQLSWLEKGFVRVIFGESLSGSLEASERYLQKALLCDPENSFAYYELFWTYKAMGDTSRAAASLHSVLALSPHSLREKCQQEEAQQQLTKLDHP